MMQEAAEQAGAWACFKCGEALVSAKTKLNYLSKDFEADLMCCPTCGNVFIGEELALGKMLEVEKSLEDK